MLDPRRDLQQDSIMWELVLACSTVYKDKCIFSNLHGFRCAGAKLSIKNNTLSFRFPIDWDESTKQIMKQKYALPYVEQFKELFKFAAQYCQEHKERDYFTRDLADKGYLS